MKCAIYIRVSTDEQANEGFSIEAQKRRLLAYAESQDWVVVEIFVDDGYSAKDMNRPELKRAIAQFDNFDVLLVYKLDRLTRSASDCDYLLKLLDSKGVSFQSATESFETRTATGRLFIRIIADLAQWERENIAERVRFGMEQMVHEGKRPGAKLPYGYTKEGAIVEEEAQVIRDIRTMYLDGLGFKSIAMRLNMSNRLRRGSEWSDATVAYTLENPYYAGLIRISSKTPDGKYVNFRKDERVEVLYGESDHPTIFTRDEYDEHAAFLRRKPKSGYSRYKDYWFSGVLRCGRCGSSMFGRLTTKRSVKSGTVRTQYYICSNRHHIKTCDMPIFRQVHIEHLLLSKLQASKINPEDVTAEIEAAKEEMKRKRAEIDQLKDQLRKIKERRKKWQYLFVEDMLTSEELKERLEMDREEEEAILERMNESADKEIDTRTLDTFFEFWKQGDDADKKELVLTTFKKLELHTDLRNVKGVKNKFFEASISIEYQ